MVDVRYIITVYDMRYDVYFPAKEIKAHILLPSGKKCVKLLLNGKETNFICEQIEKSVYANFETATSANMMSIEILL